METFTKLLEAIATLAWPGIVIAIIVIFRPAVAAIIESARSRKFTLKVGGQELTMDEASEQQRSLIADLQTQLVEVRKRLETVVPEALPAVNAAPALPAPPAARMLWVDDFPKNNSYFVEQLTNLGIKVDLALTTSEGLSLFGRRKYSCVISDMGRHEDDAENSDAGLDLLKAIRERDAQIPFLIFCSSRGVREHGAEARRLGVTGITSSPTELSGFLNLDALKAKA
jgi:CheY-like chemotaxis protein